MIGMLRCNVLQNKIKIGAVSHLLDIINKRETTKKHTRKTNKHNKEIIHLPELQLEPESSLLFPKQLKIRD